jgi:pyruvate,water dikinase
MIKQSETSIASLLSQSAPNIITSEMGFALLNVADVIRPYPKVIAHLQHEVNDNFLDELVKLNGGQQARVEAYLNKYGMRCHQADPRSPESPGE